MRKFVAGFVFGLAVLFGLTLAAGLLGYFQSEAKSIPPAWEASLAGRVVEASVARQAPHLNNPIAPTEASLLAGLKMYKEMCAGCHGDPNGESVFGAGFYPKVP